MKRVKMMLAAVAMTLGVVGANAQTINDVNTKYNEAVSLIQAKDFAAAIPVLEATINMGLNVGDEAFNTVQTAQGYLPTCNFQAGYALVRANKLEESLPYLNTAAELSELYGDTKTARNTATLLGQVYLKMGASAFNSADYAKAIAVFSKGYEANPTDTQLALYLAESYSKSGDLDNGIRVYSEIAALTHSKYAEAAATAKSKIAEYLTARASELALSGNMDGAYAVIDEILAVDATNATALLIRLQLASNAKQYANVIKWGQDAAAAQTDGALKSTALFLLGAAYQNTEKLAEAADIYKSVTEGAYAAEAKKQIAEIQKSLAAAKK